MIREAIINSLVHRDYSINSPNYLEIYDDKVIITNPGGLMREIKIKDLYQEHKSILRNPHIAKSLFLAGYIEQWGLGTLNMIREMLMNDLSLPLFETEDYFFKVILMMEKSKKDEKYIKAIKFIQRKKEIKTQELAKHLKLSERETRRVLNFLESLKLIKREGKTKNARYIFSANSD